MAKECKHCTSHAALLDLIVELRHELGLLKENLLDLDIDHRLEELEDRVQDIEFDPRRADHEDYGDVNP